MLQSAPRRLAEPTRVGTAGRRQQRRLLLAVIVLLATILVVALRDRAYWFGSDGDSVADDNDAAPTTTAPATPAPVTAPSKRPTVRAANGKIVGRSGHGGLQNASETQRLSADQGQERDLSINSPYPLLAGQMAIQGSVLLEVLIGADGVVEEMRVLSGPTILVSAAREAVQQWRFRPFVVSGQPVETQARVTVNFRIKVSDTVAANQVESTSSEGEL
jgi:TonB family protein